MVLIVKHRIMNLFYSKKIPVIAASDRLDLVQSSHSHVQYGGSVETITIASRGVAWRVSYELKHKIFVIQLS